MRKEFTYEQLVEKITEELSLMTGVNEIKPDTSFEQLRVNSIHAMQLLDELEEITGLEISPLVLFEYPTISSFARKIVSLR